MGLQNSPLALTLHRCLSTIHLTTYIYLILPLILPYTNALISKLYTNTRIRRTRPPPLLSPPNHPIYLLSRLRTSVSVYIFFLSSYLPSLTHTHSFLVPPLTLPIFLTTLPPLLPPPKLPPPSPATICPPPGPTFLPNMFPVFPFLSTHSTLPYLFPLPISLSPHLISQPKSRHSLTSFFSLIFLKIPLNTLLLYPPIPTVKLCHPYFFPPFLTLPSLFPLIQFLSS